jgi:DNA-directed RNA polymerase subunit beta'
VLAEVAGRVEWGERRRNGRVVFIQPVDDEGKPMGAKREHLVPPGRHQRAYTGEYVVKGDPLAFGPLVPYDLLRLSGITAVQDYLLDELRLQYRNQRVDLDDKHLEIIIAQMLRKVRIETGGDTGLLPGTLIDRCSLQEINNRLRECVKVKEPAVATQQVLGITRAALPSDSFIAATASQAIAGVLSDAALAGRIDPLSGLKENLILGRLLPVGTGFRPLQERGSP